MRCSGPEYHWIEGKCIYYEKTRLKYEAAKANCATKIERGRLFEPKSLTMSKMVARKANGKNLDWALIGVNDINQSGKFVYNTDSKPIMFTPKWYSSYGQANSGSGETYNYVAIGTHGNYVNLWVEIDSPNYRRASICENSF